MGNIWLHIGSPKTGTTSLQGFLNDNAAQLRETGRLNYVEASRPHIAHNQLASAARTGTADRALSRILREADAAADMPNVVSSELLFNPHNARKIVAAIPDGMIGRTKVIAYIRRQDSYLEALYKQLLKNSRIAPDRPAFLADAKRRVRYLETFNTYAEIFGAENIIVRPFGPDHLVGACVVADFAHHLGLDLTPELHRPAGFANKTFSAEMSELLAQMGTYTDFNTREVIRELIELNHPGTIKSRDVFTKSERRSLLESMTKENRKLSRRFMPEHKAFFGYKDLDGPDEPTEDRAARQAEDRAAASEALMIAMGKLQRRKREDVQLDDQSDVQSPEQSALEELTQPPTWYREIYPGGERTGWYHGLGDYSASFVERGTKQLVVSFDNLSQAGNDAYAREPWAQKFCAEREFSHLGIYAQKPTWFRDQSLIEYLEGLKDEGVFAKFDRVAFVGTSMGAFGALTFSSLRPGSTVVAFSPQTTLDTDLVSWETRFAKGRNADWTLPYSDAAQQTKSASNVFVVYDPFHAGDRKHVERLGDANVTHLRGIGLGHKSALVLNRMEALKPIMEGAISGELQSMDFYRLIRARKDIFLYRQAMEGYLKEMADA